MQPTRHTKNPKTDNNNISYWHGVMYQLDMMNGPRFIN